MLASRDGLLSHPDLVPRGNGNVNNLHIRVREQFLKRSRHTRTAVVARRFFGSFPPLIVTGDNAQAMSAVRGEVRVIDDAAAANNANPIIMLGWQRDLVINLVSC